jgi:hypothetical protein
MSHVVTIQTKVHDAAAVAAACRRLELATPSLGTVELFSGKATGLIVQLPGWEYPAVVDTLTGAIRYDNFDGHWGDQQHLDRFLQMYAVEKCRLEARHKGYQTNEFALEDGSIKIQIIERVSRCPHHVATSFDPSRARPRSAQNVSAAFKGCAPSWNGNAPCWRGGCRG